MVQKLQFKSPIGGYVPHFGEFEPNQLVQPDSEEHAKALLKTGHFAPVRVIAATTRKPQNEGGK